MVRSPHITCIIQVQTSPGSQRENESLPWSGMRSLMGKGELAVLCFVIDEGTLPFFLSTGYHGAVHWKHPYLKCLLLHLSKKPWEETCPWIITWFMIVQKHLTGSGEFRLRCKQPAVGCDLLQCFTLKRCGLLISPATKLHGGHFFPPLSDSYTLLWCSLARNPSACGQWCKHTSCLWRTTLNPAGGRSLPRASLSSAA